MKLKDLRIKAGLTQQSMSDKLEIPVRTIGSWENGSRKCPGYVEKLVTEKLENIIKENARKALEEAQRINEYCDSLPMLEVGDIAPLADVWDGKGNTPKNSYSYYISDDNGENFCPYFLHYEFEVAEEKESQLDTLVKITNIWLG